jgi:subtilisin family serine protease
MKQKITFWITMGLFPLVSIAQQQVNTTNYYYYYKGEQQYLELNTKKAVIASDINTSGLVNQLTTIGCQYGVDTILLHNGYQEIYFSDTLSSLLYLNRIDSLNTNYQSNIEPYLKTGNENQIRLSNYFYVKLKQLSDSVLLIQKAGEMNVEIVSQNQFMPLWFVLKNHEQATVERLNIVNAFYESGLFQAAEPDFYSTDGNLSCETITDPLWGDQWNLNNTGQYNSSLPNIDIRACNAWDLSTGENTVIAIVDDGISYNHPDLYGNMYPIAYNADNDTENFIFGSHGTEVASVVGSIRNNIGTVGVAYNCKLMSVARSSPYDNNYSLFAQKNANGINWAWKHGADVINLSWESFIQSLILEEAIDSAIMRGRNGKGSVVVGAAGNSGYSTVTYPASLSNVIAVGMINPDGKRQEAGNYNIYGGSHYGDSLDLVAPGILIPVIGGDSFILDAGTSLAAPQVAGIAALMFSVNPDLTSTQVRNIIESTARKVRTDLYSYNTVKTNGMWNNEMGYGLVDAYAAVYMAAYGVLPSNVDLMIIDGEIEINEGANIHNVMWKSPDIWVRNTNDNGLVHQNPLPNASNYVHVRIRNIGYQTSTGNEKLYLYWAKGDTSLTWDYHWTGNYHPNNSSLLLGHIIDSISIPCIAPWKDTIVKIPWYAPDTVDYSGIFDDPWAFCLLARIVAANDTMTFPETMDIDSNVRYNNNIACRNIDIGKIDLVVRDDSVDNGTEPNPYSPDFSIGQVWDSPDIWIRHDSDNVLEHQTPLSDTLNWIYIRIKNKGSIPSKGNENLHLYWSKAGTSLSWDQYWDKKGAEYFFSGSDSLSQIQTGASIYSMVLPSIPANGDTIICFPWQYVPNPVNYENITLVYYENGSRVYEKIITNSWHFHLLARIEAENDIMTFPETTNIDSNIRNNNNIACKSIWVGEITDLMIRDNTEDMGLKPNPYNGNIWSSPDLWTRRWDVPFDGIHQDLTPNTFSDPENPNPTYYLNSIGVHIRNRGNHTYLPSDSAQLFLYWAKAGMSGIDNVENWNLLSSQYITDNVSRYPDSAFFYIQWNTTLPHPAYYADTEEPWHFYLLAVIKSKNDPVNYTGNIQNDIKNNNNIAGRSVNICHDVDFIIKDTPDDTGIEPNRTPNDILHSPSIWVRHDTNTVSNIHQHIKPNQTNHIYVRVRNLGCQTGKDTNGNAKMSLYWAKKGTNLNLPTSWHLIMSTDITPIPAGKEGIVHFVWNNPPNPVNYQGFDEPYQFYLLAKVQSTIDPMTFPETNNIDSNVRNSNNIACRSIEIGNRVDLMIKDTDDDTGIEPNPSSGIMYDSPDIWIRHAADMEETPQNPIGNKTNYVHVRVKNKGDIPSSGNETLHLYWSKAGANLG